MNLAPQRSILIVEDERLVAKDIRETLAGMGYDAFATASSADEAIARACVRCPDVVLMDIRIKGARDGIETAAVLRERFGVAVVFLTAHADEATIERAKRTEPYGYLLKPVKPGELRSAIEVALYRHEMEKRLRERERWFSTTLRSIGDAVITVDLSGKVTFMNPAAETLTGTSATDGIGRPASEVIRLLDAEAHLQSETPLDRALRDQCTVESGELALLGSGMVSRIIADSASPVSDNGQVLGAVMVFRDVTQDKLLHKQLELADRLSSLGTMAAGVAHEVNNPLSVVVANALYLHGEMTGVLHELRSCANGANETAIPQVEDAVQVIDELQAAAHRIATIVADLKAFSRPTQESPGDVDVRRTIEWAVRSTVPEFRNRALVTTKATPGLTVKADETRLGQVLINLLLNAAHAITPGNVEKNQVSVSARAVENGRIVIDVSDTGSGIAPELLKRIFEPFFTTKPVGTGTGLGLSICQGIVKALGGELSVSSTLGKGSTFSVLLPASIAVREGSSPPPVSEQKLRGRILVVDDEKLVLSAIRRLLKGHELVCVESAREALECIKRGEHFDIILSDLMMPGMTGVELYEALLARDPELANRVIFLTGGAASANVQDFLNSIPNARLDKPFDVGTMLTAVQTLLARQREQSHDKPRVCEAVGE